MLETPSLLDVLKRATQEETRVTEKPLPKSYLKVLEYLQDVDSPLLATEISTGLGIKDLYLRKVLAQLLQRELIVSSSASDYRQGEYKTVKVYQPSKKKGTDVTSLELKVQYVASLLEDLIAQGVIFKIEGKTVKYAILKD